MDEILISSDFQQIVDDDLRKHLVDPLPTGSRLTAIFDSCHSGTMLDLPHYRCNSFRAERRDSLPVAPTSPEDELSVMALRTRSTRRARTVATEAELKQRGKPIVKAKFTKFKAVVRAIMMMKSARSRVKSSAIMPYTKIRQSVSVAHPASATHKCGPRCRLEIKAVPTVISISACEDHQRSWEVDFDGDGSESIHSASSVSSNGSMTKALINILENTPSISVEHMHLKLSDHLWQDAFAKQRFAIRFIKQHGAKYTKKQIEKMKEDLEFDVQTPQIGSLAPLRGDEIFIVGRRDVRGPSTFGFVPRLIKNM
ncbi:uncharacterized protein STEHIDRAFT_167179 [Stereum hirsutum FP-91666 SS1]|uniref:uncharacterized protein n=1 Tax=Stereum hirsutum (strain FP-91666) TaxID=721885 RepID=UPI000440A50F|nr:uncharacterized protein STEHIDRAFT_167179 [Stereum hirsutum FP-91666 SS1]EIM89372.1 hypothetical protein STEHIDRAFT_167179 [Stereum hirsutum FP-91666 SS1]